MAKVGRKKGTTKTGGRQKGTPNKVTKDLKEWIEKIIASNERQFEKDLQLLTPQERTKIIVSLMAYVVPKQQAFSVDAEIKAFNELLANADEQAIEKIASKMLELQDK